MSSLQVPSSPTSPGFLQHEPTALHKSPRAVAGQRERGACTKGPSSSVAVAVSLTPGAPVTDLEPVVAAAQTQFLPPNRL